MQVTPAQVAAHYAKLYTITELVVRKVGAAKALLRFDQHNKDKTLDAVGVATRAALVADHQAHIAAL